MSRIIDADELKRAFIGNRYGTKAIEYVIDNVPTVEAIPIEWIRKYTNHRTVEFGDMWVFINCMINDWEQENGKSGNSD